MKNENERNFFLQQIYSMYKKKQKKNLPHYLYIILFIHFFIQFKL